MVTWKLLKRCQEYLYFLYSLLGFFFKTIFKDVEKSVNEMYKYFDGSSNLLTSINMIQLCSLLWKKQNTIYLLFKYVKIFNEETITWS